MIRMITPRFGNFLYLLHMGTFPEMALNHPNHPAMPRHAMREPIPLAIYGSWLSARA